MVLSRIDMTCLWFSGSLLPQLLLKLAKGNRPNPNCLLRRFDPETAKKLADIKQMEAALRRKEIAEAEAKRLAEKHQRVKSARIANQTHRVINLVNDLELL